MNLIISSPHLPPFYFPHMFPNSSSFDLIICQSQIWFYYITWTWKGIEIIIFWITYIFTYRHIYIYIYIDRSLETRLCMNPENNCSFTINCQFCSISYNANTDRFPLFHCSLVQRITIATWMNTTFKPSFMYVMCPLTQMASHASLAHLWKWLKGFMSLYCVIRCFNVVGHLICNLWTMALVQLKTAVWIVQNWRCL
jgi:hypothetical protein